MFFTAGQVASNRPERTVTHDDDRLRFEERSRASRRREESGRRSPRSRIRLHRLDILRYVLPRPEEHLDALIGPQGSEDAPSVLIEGRTEGTGASFFDAAACVEVGVGVAIGREDLSAGFHWCLKRTAIGGMKSVLRRGVVVDALDDVDLAACAFLELAIDPERPGRTHRSASQDRLQAISLFPRILWDSSPVQKAGLRGTTQLLCNSSGQRARTTSHIPSAHA